MPRSDVQMDARADAHRKTRERWLEHVLTEKQRQQRLYLLQRKVAIGEFSPLRNRYAKHKNESQIKL